MANRQTIPGTKLPGALAQSTIRRAHVTAPRQYEIVVNPAAELVQHGLDVAKVWLNEKIKNKNQEAQAKLNKEKARQDADDFLRSVRTALVNSSNLENFNQTQAAGAQELARLTAAPAPVPVQSVAASVPAPAPAPTYWQENGAALMKANQNDTNRIYAEKGAEFGRDTLNEVLAKNQNTLAYATGKEGEMLLERGAKAISQTPFLSEEERGAYRQGYLNTGILNLALNDPDTAYTAVDKHLSGDENARLKVKIGEVAKKREEFAKAQEAESERFEALAKTAKAFANWQNLESGVINPAQFYVLNAEDEENTELWGLTQTKSPTPLFEAYKTVKKMSGGEKVGADEVRDAGNFLISAYKNKELDLATAAGVQNSFAEVINGGFNTDGKLAIELADAVFGQDASSLAQNSEKQTFMELKAKAALDIYQAAHFRKNELLGEARAKAEASGLAFDEAKLEAEFSKQAVDEVKKACGFIEDKSGDVTYAGLKRVLNDHYRGSEPEFVWQKFFVKAPKTDDKRALLKKIAADKQREELHYPRFESYLELKHAGLEPGEKFYFRGKLAVMKG